MRPERKSEYSDKQRYMSCKRKTRFGDYFTAIKKAKELGFRVYECRLCDGYHLASSEYKP